jgi:hypothetical protein
MRGWIRLGLLLSALWVVGVLVFTISEFLNIPSTACNFYHPENLGGASPPAEPIELERIQTYLFSCSIFTDFDYPNLLHAWKSYVISIDTQLIEFNIFHLFILLFIPLVSAWVAVVSLVKSIRWVKNGFKN